ncbi:ferritin-like domain-containing protein [Phormidium sp. CCY1219]|jgi:rubrerythrin|uniref:ferritin-like domain-containing protein n=1 Tax=Phormidium sp. CCY1219 TaxID=2886104 RepID=UPI002D1F133F|nr:DUF2202 domain-containing protein [Phormidium sp. CCY1219]MEB3831445.1 DUF2202 domain-containing protein [Phormidium sp. CCY1219]
MINRICRKLSKFGGLDAGILWLVIHFSSFPALAADIEPGKHLSEARSPLTAIASVTENPDNIQQTMVNSFQQHPRRFGCGGSGHRKRYGQGKFGGCGRGSFTAQKANPRASKTLDAETHQALIEAINDEYKARAFYEAILNKFGPIRPFSNIIHSEARHAEMLKRLFVKYGLPIPEDTFTGNMEAPESLFAACQAGIQGELDNMEMYDRFFSVVREPDILDAFSRLQSASQQRHLPAFQRCARRYSQSQ